CGRGRFASASDRGATGPDGEAGGDADAAGEGEEPREQATIDDRTTTATRCPRMVAQARVPPGGSQPRPAVASRAMFSTRTGWDLTPNRLSSQVEARRKRGERVLDLTETNPTRVGLEYPPDLLAPLADPAALTYEPSPRGLASAREAVSADHARRGVTVDPGRVLLTASTSEAYAWLFKLLCDPGDAVLVPRPSYPLFAYLARLEGVRPIPYRLAFDGAGHVDLATVEQTLAEGGSSPRALIAVNPNYPTGSFI